MLRRLACLLLPAASVALLPDPPFECDNARCRVRPRATIYAAERVCAPGNYTCASCCDPGPDCRCGADSFEHATAPTANATAVRLHLRAAFPDDEKTLAALSDAHAVEAFKGLACRPCLRVPSTPVKRGRNSLVGVHTGMAHAPVPRGLLRVRGLLRPRRGLRLRRRVRPGRRRGLRARLRRRRRQARRVVPCVEIKILRRVRAESSRRPPRHRCDVCSMA